MVAVRGIEELIIRQRLRPIKPPLNDFVRKFNNVHKVNKIHSIKNQGPRQIRSEEPQRTKRLAIPNIQRVLNTEHTLPVIPKLRLNSKSNYVPPVIPAAKLWSIEDTLGQLPTTIDPPQSLPAVPPILSEPIESLPSKFSEYSIEFATSDLKKLVRGVQEHDLKCLNPQQYLNDVLIEFGLKFWQSELTFRNPQLGNQVYIFNPFFYHLLEMYNPEEGYKRVKTWTLTNKMEVDIFSKDFIIVPIHERFHWLLAIIYHPQYILPYGQISPTSPNPYISDPGTSEDTAIETDGSLNVGSRTIIYILDSLGGSHPQVASRLSMYLRLEAREKHQCSNTSSAIERIVKVPQQPNLIDCSIYLLHFAETFVELFDSLSKASDLQEDMWKLDRIKHYRTNIKKHLIDAMKSLL
ncbi:hypothetical protein D9757_006907 [Collybiopsis confluens]|uniref:Ubiquitin-like protease family profile domain-containing protein n=1 Tax=Collybiopsis confluens TaxID=2823264 RepID=A0A8H5MAD2_9AGAR|nr:hypothetical protein D9757_006907 [Collybiopsis confluens]